MRFILHVTLIPLFCWTVASGQEHYDPEVYDFQGYVFEVVGDGHIPLPDVTVTNESGDTTTTTNTGYFCIPFGGTQNLNEALNFSKDGYKIVQKTFRGDCQFWKITMQKASSQRVTIGPEGKDHTFFCEYIENYQKEGYDNSVSLYIGPDSVDQEWNVGVTVDRVHTGYHLGINPGTGEPGFQYLGYSSFSVHVDGKQPWEHVPVSGYGNFFEIPCHEDYDSTGVMPFSLDVLVYDHHAHTWVEEVFVDNRGWLKCGYATFDPVRWIWRWEGFEFISGDFILVYTYILGKGEKTRDGLRKEPVPMPNSDRSHTMLSGHNTTKNWLEQNGIKNPENYIKRMRDSEGNYLNLNELEFIDPETGKPTTGFRISAYFGYDLDVTVSTSKTKGDHFDTKIGVSGGVSFEILDFGGSVETTAGSNWSKTRGMSQRFAEKPAAAAPYSPYHGLFFSPRHCIPHHFRTGIHLVRVPDRAGIRRVGHSDSQNRRGPAVRGDTGTESRAKRYSASGSGRGALFPQPVLMGLADPQDN